ncbi:hypothetical protein PQX77_014361 [Marasmius sp. AFHP31]|nr:hypothetical protein PQX77_014361 [Marasmius sp. AFHP31]
MSSDQTPVIKRTRSSGNSTSSRAQRSQSSISNEPQSPVETLPMLGADVDESQQEGVSGPVLLVGDPELGMKPMHDTEVPGTDTAPLVNCRDCISPANKTLIHSLVIQDPTSTKEGTTNQDEGRDQSDTGPGRSRAEEIPQDNTKTDKLAGNDTEDATRQAPNPQNPSLEKSWEVIMTEVTSLDEGLVGGWKEDIDTLLVFAGLFSAVVTAFTIESYQWLQEAPEDTSVALLRQISQQLNNTSVTEPDEFKVTSSVVAINVLWFLSLIIALVDALFALLCKQWLREHRQHTHTRTPSEALALRWLRKQSLEKWHVPTILASLPMLLELALFLFLAGLLELLRTRHPVPFSIATIVVAFAAIFYLGTTIIPAVDVARQALQVIEDVLNARKGPGGHSLPSFKFIMKLPPMEYICPYKSPQAWVAFQSLRLFSRIFGRVAWFLWRRDYIADSTYYDHLIGRFTLTSAFGQIISNLSSWSSVDLELLRRADIYLAPPFYELNAFRWLVSELRDSPHMIPHLRKVLSTIPLHLVMPAVLGQWFFLPGRKWTVGDIETVLGPNCPYGGVEGHVTVAKGQFLVQGRETRLFNYLLHWIHVSMNDGDDGMDSGRDSPDMFSTPFRSIDAMPYEYTRKKLWNIYAEIAQDPAASHFYWSALIEDLAGYIIASSPDYALHVPTATTTSLFVGSAHGREYLSKIHNTIIERDLFSWDSGNNWMEAVDILQRVHPEDHFEPLRGHFPLPLTKLRKTLNSLSPTGPGNDFQYLDEFSRGWGDANELSKVKLVEILSMHSINYPKSDAGRAIISPLVMSSAGLELITFMNDRLAEEPETCSGYINQMWWRNVIEWVRAARPELPPDHFKNIFHEGVDPPAPREPPMQQEVEVVPPPGGSGGSPRDIADEVNRDEMNVHPNSVAELSPQPEPEELDKRHPLDDGDTNGKGSMSRQLVVTEEPETASGGRGVQGEKIIGGPDADKNV